MDIIIKNILLIYKYKKKIKYTNKIYVTLLLFIK